MVCYSSPGNHSIETIPIIGCVLNIPASTVGFFQGITSPNSITISLLLLVFLIPCLQVIDAVFETVSRIGLHTNLFVNFFLSIIKIFKKMLHNCQHQSSILLRYNSFQNHNRIRIHNQI